jgi:hypothetical protein
MEMPDFNLVPQVSPHILERQESLSRSLAEQGRRNNEAIESTNYLASFQRANLASEFAKKLLARIHQFDQKLDTDQEVGVKLVSFGQTITFHVTDVGCYDPSLVLFLGCTDDGHRVELIQHVSQISFVLIALPKLHPEQPRRKIGFIQEGHST